MKFQLGAKGCEMGCEDELWPAIRCALQFSKKEEDREIRTVLVFYMFISKGFGHIQRCVFSIMGNESVHIFVCIVHKKVQETVK